MSTALAEAGAGSPAAAPARGSRAGRRLAAGVPALFLGGVTLLLSWPVLLGRTSSAVPGLQALLWPWRGVVGPSPAPALQADGAASSYPWSVSYHEALSQGSLPFWDWHSFSGGYDLASDGVSGAMYPVHWLLWTLFEPPRAHDAYVVLHLFVGGLVMYALLRHWLLARGPALVGATAWMLAPFNVGWVQAEMITPVLVVVPLVFWAVGAALAMPSWPRIVAASAAVGLTVVAGNIVVFLVVVWVVALSCAASWLFHVARERSIGSALRTARTLALVGVGALALSAYSLVPTVANLLSLSRRPSPLAAVLPEQASVPDVLRSLWSPPPLDSSMALFMLHWCGRIVLLLALLGLLHRGGRRALALTLVVFFTLLPMTPLVVQVGWYAVPPLRAVSGFGRLAFLASFGMAVLAASGTAVLVSLLGRLHRSVARVRHDGPVQLAAGALVAAAVVVELFPFARAVNPPWTDPRAMPLIPVTEAVEVLASPGDGWPGLVLPLSSVPAGGVEPTGYSLWGATANAAGVDSVGGYDSAVPTRATALTQVMQGVPVETAFQPIGGAFLPNFAVTWTRLDLAQRIGVTHVYAPPGVSMEDSAYAAVLPEMELVHDAADGRVWELKDPMRSPRLVARATTVTSPTQALTRFTAPDHDPRRVVVLEGRRASAAADGVPVAGDEAPPGIVRSARRGPDRAVVEVDARRPAWLVVPIGFAPGWHAEAAGRSVEVRPADGAMSAVRVPAGRHTVTFTYRPRGFTAGAATTGVALVTALALLVAARPRRQTAPHRPEERAHA